MIFNVQKNSRAREWYPHNFISFVPNESMHWIELYWRFPSDMLQLSATAQIYDVVTK